MNKLATIFLGNKYVLATYILLLTFTGYAIGLTLAYKYSWLYYVAIISGIICVLCEVYALYATSKVDGLHQYKKIFVMGALLVLATMFILIVLPQFIIPYSAVISIVITIISMKYFDMIKLMYGIK